MEEFDELAVAAMAGNPRVQAARHRLEQALARQRERSGFFDPEFVGAAGQSSTTRSTPGVTPLMTVPDHAAVLNLSVETPIQPGAYVGLGVSERWFSEAGDPAEDLNQTLVGARLRIPLLRDRGFRQYETGSAQDLALLEQAASLLVAEVQSVLHELEQRYIATRQASALQAVAREATVRFEVLLKEAQKLVELGVTPSYQLLTAEMELELRRSEENEARQAYETSLVTLAQVLGRDEAVRVAGDASSLIAWADSVQVDTNCSVAVAAPARGSYQAIRHGIDVVEAEVDQARDDMRSDLSIELGTTWQGESRDGVLGDQRILSEDHLGGEALVVLRRPLGFRAERSRVDRGRARIAELNEALREAELDIRAGLTSSRLTFAMARERLAMVSRAVKAAADAVEAERERFRLGEGRSRNVLDAQKDLTGATRRQAEIAGAVLRAYSDFRFAAGRNAERCNLDNEITNARGGARP